MASATPPLVKALTVVLFAALAVAAFGVFVVLPERVAERQQPQGFVEAPLEASTPSVPTESLRSEAPARRPPPPFEKGGNEGGFLPEPRTDGRLAPPENPPPAPPFSKGGRRDETEVPRQDDAFVQAMSDGLAALERQDYAAARAAFERAQALRPGAAEAADGLLRAAAGERRAAVAEHRRQAADDETRERWHAALERYEAALAIDGTLAFAQEGRRRSGARAELTELLAFHVAHPERLSADGVLREATELLDRAAAATPAGPRHQRQVAELRSLVEAYSTPVRAVLRSDAATEVMVYKVGRLGTFTERALELRPGTYTVVGSRRGYRDVRRQLVVEPGRDPEPLVVRCEEKI